MAGGVLVEGVLVCAVFYLKLSFCDLYRMNIIVQLKTEGSIGMSMFTFKYSFTFVLYAHA